MRKIILTIFLTFLFTVSTTYAVNPTSNYLIWNDGLNYTHNVFSEMILKQNERKELTYNIGKFNETYELYKVLTEILEKHNIYSNEFLFLCLGIAAVETYNGQYLNNPVAQRIISNRASNSKINNKDSKKDKRRMGRIIRDCNLGKFPTKKTIKRKSRISSCSLIYDTTS